MSLKVLFIGESWFVQTTETKGVDSFSVGKYEEAREYIEAALVSGGIQFDYIPCHRVEYDFPETLEGLSAYDVVVLSDVGANTMLLPSKAFSGAKGASTSWSLSASTWSRGADFA